jgi:hypothetical protein
VQVAIGEERRVEDLAVLAYVAASTAPCEAVRDRRSETCRRQRRPALRPLLESTVADFNVRRVMGHKARGGS